MTAPKHISIEDFDYPLPDERIAKFPLEKRDESKLLKYSDGEISEHVFHDLPDLLPKGTMLVFNNTKVIHARLFFQKESGAAIEIFCLKPYMTAVSTTFEERERCKWICLVGNNKKWKSGGISRSFTVAGKDVVLTAERKEPHKNAWIVEFSWTGGFPFAEVIEQAGVMPLPPYLHREAVESDNTRYQTVYAEHKGSVAAPTAGLHFTENVFGNLKKNGIMTEFVTLHVGAGTFKPVTCEKIGDHIMHYEHIVMAREHIENIVRNSDRKIIPVGTTSVRTLESVYWFGVKLSMNPDLDVMEVQQWDPYELEDHAVSSAEAFEAVLNYLDRHDTPILEGDTQLLIAPGYRFHVIDGLITNFHQPKSTLLLLVSALIGDKWKDCYRYALDNGFRFLSYGDSCLFM